MRPDAVGECGVGVEEIVDGGGGVVVERVDDGAHDGEQIVDVRCHGAARVTSRAPLTGSVRIVDAHGRQTGTSPPCHYIN